MCLTCGCMDAHLEMGEANITYEDVKRAADENGRSVTETFEIMDRTKAKDRARAAHHPDRALAPGRPELEPDSLRSAGELETGRVDLLEVGLQSLRSSDHLDRPRDRRIEADRGLAFAPVERDAAVLDED